MQLPYKQLVPHLTKQSLLPVYLICGDLPLLIQEARDTIRDAFKKLGYHQRTLFFVESGFDWNEFKQSVDNFNLFSEKCFIEIQNPKAKFDASGTDVIVDYLQKPPADKQLLIITDKLSATQQ